MFGIFPILRSFYPLAQKLLAQFQGWWLLLRRRPDPQVPYQIACACGQVATGIRASKFQVLPCAGCGQNLFVLPFSRLPPVAAAGGEAPREKLPSRAVSPFFRSPWSWPVLGGALALLGVIVLFNIVLHSGLNERARLKKARADMVKKREEGKEALALGKFHLAVRELDAALAFRDQYPEALSAAERRQLLQCRRQAALLADLLAEPLGEVLRRAALEPDDLEWQAQFRARYQGKAVVFHDEARREAAGGYRLLGAPIFDPGGKPARLELRDLKLFRQLPLDKPRWLFFGARLADVRREDSGAWAVRFEPDSGVLITDPAAARACCPLPPQQFQELEEVLSQQAKWLESEGSKQ